MYTIIFRDSNGKRSLLQGNTSAIYEKLMSPDLDDNEILLVTYDNICIYSALANGPIDIEDLIGFFA